MASTEPVDIFTDGACSGNPGPGGWGAILCYNGVEKELSGGAIDPLWAIAAMTGAGCPMTSTRMIRCAGLKATCDRRSTSSPRTQ